MEIIIVLKSYEAIYDHGAIEWLGDNQYHQKKIGTA